MVVETNSWEETFALGKKMGEEAGTKMLLPMMGLLCIVFGIVMVPALLSFRI